MSTYKELFGTKTYMVVEVNGTYRVENRKGPYAKEVPHIEIPKEMIDSPFPEWLVDYKEFEMTKAEGKQQFDSYCEMMFDEEHSELYPESVK
jgi:hypothetical protein